MFPLDRRNAELGLDAGVRKPGGEATENEASSRRTGAAEPRHTKANAANPIPSGQIEGGTAATGRASRSRMGSHDDGFAHGQGTLRERQAESGGIHMQRELTGDSSAEHLL